MNRGFFILFGVLLSGLVLAQSAHAACPLGKGEDRLTLPRVMRNFGRSIMHADYLCVKSRIPQESVTDAEIHNAIEKLSLVLDCAEEVLRDPTGERLPSKINLLESEQKKVDLADDFIYFMTEFKDTVMDYRDSFQTLLKKTPSERNFTDVCEKYQDVNRVVNRAHKKL